MAQNETPQKRSDPLSPGAVLPAAARWERSEYPHPKFPAAMRALQLLPDVIWLRYHGNEVTGWAKSAPTYR